MTTSHNNQKFGIVPLTLQVHLGNPKMARIPELKLRAMPECEGGGWFMPADQAEALVDAWNNSLKGRAGEEDQP